MEASSRGEMSALQLGYRGDAEKGVGCTSVSLLEFGLGWKVRHLDSGI